MRAQNGRTQAPTVHKRNHLIQISTINAFDMFIHGYFPRNMSSYLLIHTTARDAALHVNYLHIVHTKKQKKDHDALGAGKVWEILFTTRLHKLTTLNPETEDRRFNRFNNQHEYIWTEHVICCELSRCGLMLHSWHDVLLLNLLYKMWASISSIHTDTERSRMWRVVFLWLTAWIESVLFVYY